MTHALVCLQLKYNQLMYGLAAENIMLNRKALSELAANEPATFKARHSAQQPPACTALL